MDLAGQVAVVTGAASGIGRELARQLVASRCAVALVDNDEQRLCDTADELARGEAAISTHAIDVGDERAVQRAVAAAVHGHGRISILINNAGVAISAPFEDTDPAGFEQLMRTNFQGAVYMCRHALPLLKEQPEARIMNVASLFAVLGAPNKVAYCSSKAALVGFSGALYTELAHTSVRVCIAIPPAVATNLIKDAREAHFVARHGLPVDVVARKMIAGMLRGTFRIRIGVAVRLIDTVCRLSPTAVHALAGRFRRFTSS